MRTKIFFFGVLYTTFFLATALSQQATAMGLGHLLCSIKYTPTMESIEGIPVNQIDESWSRALILTDNNFTGCLDLNKIPFLDEEEKKIAANMKKNGFKFSREGDFNNDGIKDKALVGVYQDKLGKLGNFLLVITEGAPKKWRKDFLVKIPSERLSDARYCLFTVLAYRDKNNSFDWTSSISGTDNTFFLLWENGKYTLKYSGDYLPTVYKPGRD